MIGGNAALADFVNDSTHRQMRSIGRAMERGRAENAEASVGNPGGRVLRFDRVGLKGGRGWKNAKFQNPNSKEEGRLLHELQDRF